MRIEFDGVKQLSGDITQMTARVGGKVYQYSHVIPKEDEAFRASIEEHMFVQIARDIYLKEIKN
ncbi:hypothetical protein F5_00024 [Xanthomonas phage F5]|uniref:Uncharacterized protein n=1 Tax=Xanthomonas phage F5 TaxID=3003369 RepID=A0AAF0AI72_9CAUD|nr:hypothetical protein F5_00024 [Xanthomonas phage F5]